MLVFASRHHGKTDQLVDGTSGGSERQVELVCQLVDRQRITVPAEDQQSLVVGGALVCLDEVIYRVGVERAGQPGQELVHCSKGLFDPA